MKRASSRLASSGNQKVDDRVLITVAEAAGAATSAQLESGVLLMQQATQSALNPVGAWSLGAEDSIILGKRDLLDAVHQAIGTLQDRQRVAERSERSMAGRAS